MNLSDKINQEGDNSWGDTFLDTEDVKEAVKELKEITISGWIITIEDVYRIFGKELI